MVRVREPAPSLVKSERRGAVGVVWLSEPERLNPLSTYPGGSEEQLARAIVAFDADTDIKVIVITGEGRAFSAGADARPATSMTYSADQAVLRALSAGIDDDEGRGWAMWFTMERCSKPIIAAVHGWCVAGGWELAMWCDMIIADETAQFSLAEVQLGVFPCHGTTFLAGAIGRWRAAELCYTGRTMDVEEAATLGLVTEVVDAGTHVNAAVALGETIAEFPSPALAAIRRSLNRTTMSTSDFDRNRRDFVLVNMTDSAREWRGRWRERFVSSKADG